MNKTVKIIAILMVALMVLMTCTPVFAGTPATGGQAQGQGQTGGASTGGSKDFGGVTVSPDTSSGQKVSGLGNKVLGVIRVVGTIIAVGVLMVIGIKYMMGSAEEKAEYKKTMLPYVIGAIILFAGVQIAYYIFDMAGTFIE